MAPNICYQLKFVHTIIDQAKPLSACSFTIFKIWKPFPENPNCQKIANGHSCMMRIHTKPKYLPDTPHAQALVQITTETIFQITMSLQLSFLLTMIQQYNNTPIQWYNDTTIQQYSSLQKLLLWLSTFNDTTIQLFTTFAFAFAFYFPTTRASKFLLLFNFCSWLLLQLSSLLTLQSFPFDFAPLSLFSFPFGFFGIVFLSTIKHCFF